VSISQSDAAPIEALREELAAATGERAEIVKFSYDYPSGIVDLSIRPANGAASDEDWRAWVQAKLLLLEADNSDVSLFIQMRFV